MPEFFNVLPPEQAFATLQTYLRSMVGSDVIPLHDSLGRVSSKNIVSPENLPGFARSTMDGFSVLARDTFGASSSLPSYLNLIGAIQMGERTSLSIVSGQTAQAYTGGMLANGADAVVMLEHTQILDEETIEILRPVAPGENVVQVGEDIRKGDRVLSKGHTIRPQDIGGLSALGITSINVTSMPKVGIISTGDELIEAEKTPQLGQIRDINTHTISNLVRQSGGIPLNFPIVKDHLSSQIETATEAIAQSDILVFSAGSSVSNRDMTADVFNSLGNPGVILHGLSIKPGKPTIMAIVDGKPAIGLPGNPVSAMIVFGLIVKPTIRFMLGCIDSPPNYVTCYASKNIPSQSGREDYIPVKIVNQGDKFLADPVFGKSNLIYTLVRADGMVKIPIDKGGIYEGESVKVFPIV